MLNNICLLRLAFCLLRLVFCWLRLLPSIVRAHPEPPSSSIVPIAGLLHLANVTTPTSRRIVPDSTVSAVLPCHRLLLQIGTVHPYKIASLNLVDSKMEQLKIRNNNQINFSHTNHLSLPPLRPRRLPPLSSSNIDVPPPPPC